MLTSEPTRDSELETPRVVCLCLQNPDSTPVIPLLLQEYCLFLAANVPLRCFPNSRKLKAAVPHSSSVSSDTTFKVRRHRLYTPVGQQLVRKWVCSPTWNPWPGSATRTCSLGNCSLLCLSPTPGKRAGLAEEAGCPLG